MAISLACDSAKLSLSLRHGRLEGEGAKLSVGAAFGVGYIGGDE